MPSMDCYRPTMSSQTFHNTSGDDDDDDEHNDNEAGLPSPPTI